MDNKTSEEVKCILFSWLTPHHIIMRWLTFCCSATKFASIHPLLIHSIDTFHLVFLGRKNRVSCVPFFHFLLQLILVTKDRSARLFTTRNNNKVGERHRGSWVEHQHWLCFLRDAYSHVWDWFVVQFVVVGYGADQMHLIRSSLWLLSLQSVFRPSVRQYLLETLARIRNSVSTHHNHMCRQWRSPGTWDRLQCHPTH